MTDSNPTAVHIKTLVDSGCTLDPAVISGILQAERATAINTYVPNIRTEVKAAVEEWFADVSLDDLYLVKGWAPECTRGGDDV